MDPVCSDTYVPTLTRRLYTVGGRDLGYDPPDIGEPYLWLLCPFVFNSQVSEGCK